MRRRRMNLTEKIFLIKKYYSNSEDWTAVQNDFNKEYNVETSQDIEKLILLVVKRFESTGSVAQEVLFGNGFFIEELIEEEVLREEESVLKEEPPQSISPSASHSPFAESTQIEDDHRSISPASVTPSVGMDNNDDDNGDSQSASDSASSEDGEEFNPIAEMASYGCQKCCMSFKSANALSKHNRYRHKPKPNNGVLCPKCGKTVKPAYLTTHLKVHIPVSEREVEKCPICSKMYRGSLKRHIARVHQDKFRHVCEVCGKTLNSSDSLKVHMRIHTKDCPYKCHLCPREYTTTSSLKVHLRIHFNERPYKCPHCEKDFYDKGSLKVHIRQHTGEAPYVCHLCGRACKQAQNLRSHIRHIHSKER